MAAGTLIKLKRKAGAFVGGDLAAGEVGIDTSNDAVYGSSDGSTVFEITGSGTGSGNSVKETITVTHAFTGGEAVYLNGSTWTASANTSIAASEVIGVIESVTGTTSFVIVYSGKITRTTHGFTVGAALFLGTAGALTTTEPTTEGVISKPVGVVLDANTLLIIPMRGVEIGGTGVPTMELLSTATPSAVASADIILPAGYSHYRLVVSNLTPATDSTTVHLRTSTDGGSSYDSAASSYSYAGETITNGGTTTAVNSAGAVQIALTGAVGNAANENADLVIEIINPSGAVYTSVLSQATFVSPTGLLTQAVISGMRLSAADVDAVRILMSSGNLSATSIKLYGIQ